MQFSERVRQGSGSMIFLKPGHMRWDYTAPDHQVLVSDGESITMYFEKNNQMISQLLALISARVWGELASGLSLASSRPSCTALISSRMAISASQNRSSSASDSDSVGSTIRVPATGNDMVGAWKP